MKRIQLFLINGLLLTGTSLLMRTIGVTFNVYISNKIGAAGMGLFSLILSVYTLGVTFATSGIHLAATRLVSEELSHNSQQGVRKAMRRCMCYSLFFGTSAGLLLFFMASYIGSHWLGDSRTILSIRILAVSLPCLALSSAMHGYFTAVRRVIKSASAQLFEQFIKIALTVTGLTLLAPSGLEYACVAIVGGASLAEFASFFYTFLLYRMDLHKHNRHTTEAESPHLTKKMLRITLPVALSAYVRSGLLTLEHLLIPYGLKKNGASSEKALASYGVLQGMVLPIILFPSAFLTSFSGLLVPELTECATQKNTVRMQYIIHRVFQITLLFSIGTAGIMMCFSQELGMTIYGNAEASFYIKVLAPLIPIMYLDSTVDGMLKGLDQQLYSMRVNIVDALLSVIFVYFLLPIGGIASYLLIIFACEILNTALSIQRLLCVTECKVDILQWILKPLFCIIGATSFVKLFFSLTKWGFSSTIFGIVLPIGMTFFAYLLFLRLTGTWTKDDIGWLKGIFQTH